MPRRRDLRQACRALIGWEREAMPWLPEHASRRRHHTKVIPIIGTTLFCLQRYD